MQIIDLIAVAICVLGCGALWLLAERADRIKSTKWKLLWLLLPVPAFVITKRGPDISLLPLYLGTVIAALGFFTEAKPRRQKLAAAGAVCMLLSIPVCFLNPRYRAKSYLKDFETLFSCMREHYVLTEHKGIDWDALYAEYQPQFAEIDRTQDAGRNALVWGALSGEFHDGHVGYSYCKEDNDAAAAAIKAALGNDYGLSVMHCSDGSFAAVNTDESLAAYGIHNGTVITKWDGRSPDEVSKSSPAYGLSTFVADQDGHILMHLDSYPDIDNEIFWSGLLAAGVGGESVTVTYLDDSGAEQTAVLPKTGEYFERCRDTVNTINQGIESANLAWSKINETTACLRIKGMSYDMKSYNSAEDDAFNEMKDELRSTILQYQAEGVRDVIIDLRSNEGGSPHMVNGVVSMFAPKGEYVNMITGVWDEEHHKWATDENGNYIKGKEIKFQGEQLLGDGRVILLVNSETVSAGDDMVKIMSDMENVTILGFTQPNGSCQAVNFQSADFGSLSFSGCVTLDQDGSIFIDSGKDRQSTDGDAVQIVPFDAAAIHALFDVGRTDSHMSTATEEPCSYLVRWAEENQCPVLYGNRN